MIQAAASQAVAQLGRVILGPIISSALRHVRLASDRQGRGADRSQGSAAERGRMSLAEYTARQPGPSSDHIRGLD